MLQERTRRKNPGYVHPDLAVLDRVARPPQASAYLLGWFHELSATRGAVPFTRPLADGRLLSGYRSMALAPSEIGAWCRQAGISLSPWEFRVMLALDRVYMAALDT